MPRRFLTDIEVPVVKLTQPALFNDEAISLGEAAQMDNAVKGELDPKLVPAGGNQNQVLVKVSNADHDVAWANQNGGGGPSNTCFPFFLSNGVQDNIETLSGFLTFFLSNGLQDDINLVSC